ncbi:MAG: hypothetical protein KY456_03575 [Chloroflexi bacterium]|nr:hypothetical protein [Chloroflexota bacterium]
MLDAYRDLIDDLLSTPSDIRELVTASGELGASPEVKRLVAEIRDRDRSVLERVQKMTREDTPCLSAIRSIVPNEHEDLSTLLDEMEVARGDLVSLLINLSLKDWTRQAVDETGNEITLADEIEQHVEFDERLRRTLRETVSRS